MTTPTLLLPWPSEYIEKMIHFAGSDVRAEKSTYMKVT